MIRVPVTEPQVARHSLDPLPQGARRALVLVALADVHGALGPSGPALGLLTALPVLCMAWCAPGAHRLAHRLGGELTTLALATRLRPALRRSVESRYSAPGGSATSACSRSR